MKHEWSGLGSAPRIPWLYSSLSKTKRLVLGRQGNDGWLFKTVVYALLISVGFVYLYPILYMVSQSFKSLKDLLDPGVVWIPKHLNFANFVDAWHTLDFPKTFGQTAMNSVLPALAQCFACALAGYGFARFEFPGKVFFLLLMIITFVIPTQVIMIPLFLLFKQYGMLGTPLPFLAPALFGGGLKSALFLLIYMQFFRSVPAALEESAQIDGAGHFKIFYRIILPISIPAIVTVFLFSLVWHWNETYTASLYLGDKMTTLPLKLSTFNADYTKQMMAKVSGKHADINESIKFAAMMLVILPLLVLYLFAQRKFVEVVDKAGITGE